MLDIVNRRLDRERVQAERAALSLPPSREQHARIAKDVLIVEEA